MNVPPCYVDEALDHAGISIGRGCFLGEVDFGFGLNDEEDFGGAARA